MKLLKRILISLLILLTVNLYLPKITFAGQDLIKKPLEIRSTPEEDIPTEKVKKTSGWTWVILAALAGGLVYAFGGGDDGDDTGDDTGDTGDDGDEAGDDGEYTITW